MTQSHKEIGLHFGKIRFVGGSKHNQHLNVSRFLAFIDLAVPPEDCKPVKFKPTDVYVPTYWEKETYKLVEFTTTAGTRFLEYLLATEKPENHLDFGTFWPARMRAQ